ncbi:MAG: hypothetical protein HY741_07780 [Chloroflexi bacterium]|nr:hypothetical protein [Chloroflexota bacterium]
MSRARPVKHFSLHRIGETELRVIADVEDGVLHLIDIQIQVLQKFSNDVRWQRDGNAARTITLFILRNLESLVQHLAAQAALPSMGWGRARPILNVYDLAHPTASNIFVNQEGMERAGYWNDEPALSALLAHELAHPLAECETTHALRNLTLILHPRFAANLFRPDANAARVREWKRTLEQQVRELFDKLCLYGPREVLANALVLELRFTDALLHLDVENVRRAAASIVIRPALQEQLQAQVETERVLTHRAAAALLALGDMQSHLDFALETAAFYRQGKLAEAKMLERAFQVDVLAHVDPEVRAVYPALCDQLAQLPQNLTRAQTALQVKQLAGILDRALRAKGIGMECQVV